MRKNHKTGAHKGIADKQMLTNDNRSSGKTASPNVLTKNSCRFTISFWYSLEFASFQYLSHHSFLNAA